jgi:hypothetical protein
MVLEHLEELRADEKLVSFAVQQTGGKAAAFAHVDLRKNRKFMLDTIRINHQCIGHAHKDLRKDREFMLEAIKNHHSALEYLDSELRKDYEFMSKAQKKYKPAILRAETATRKNLVDADHRIRKMDPTFKFDATFFTVR